MKSKMKILGWAIFFLALFKVFSAPAFCKDVNLKSPWITQPMKIDGQLGDWPESAATFLKDPEATVGVCNDSERVYIRLSFRNARWARLIKMGGLTIWLDGQGKDHKDFMLRFNGGPSRAEMMEQMRKSGNSQNQASPGYAGREREGGEERAASLICSKKDYLEEKEVPMDGSQGPSAAFGEEKDFYIYEFSVPFKESTPMYYGLGIAPNKAISVGLIWGEMDRSKMRKERPNIGGLPGGMGGGGGGMMPGGGGGMGDQDRSSRMGQEAPKKQEVWLKAELTGANQTENQSAGEKGNK
jgi:hypothetical protein